MPEMIKKEALQLEPMFGSYRAFMFSHTFPMEKPFNCNPLKLPSLTHVRDALVVKSRQCVVSNNKLYTFSSLMVNCSLEDTSKGTVKLLQL